MVYNRASTGLLIEEMLRRMGIEAQVAPKAQRPTDGAAVMEHLLQGRGREVGFGAMTEILLFRERGLRFVGPLRRACRRTPPTRRRCRRPAAAPEPARELLAHLAKAESQRLFAAAGVEAAP